MLLARVVPAAGRQPLDARIRHEAAGQRPALPAACCRDPRDGRRHRSGPETSFSFQPRPRSVRTPGVSASPPPDCALFAIGTVSINVGPDLPGWSRPAARRAIDRNHKEAPCAASSSCSPPICSPSAWASAWASICCRS
ncbi:hypothetical protein PEM_01560 [Stenotrophomonas sp. Pemsol]|nr:hypothetical protein PEM_01560 [Stenotrophomonas sp. Pemsol]